MIIMEERVLEPGLLKIFRYYCGFAEGYFLGNFLYAFFTSGKLITSTSLLYLFNFFIFLILLGYLNWNWLEKKLKGLFLPVAILIAALAPIYSSLILWPLQPHDTLTDIIYRSWMFFPILIVPIVLVAWQYSIAITITMVALTAFYDLPFILTSIDSINLETIPFIGVPILRSIVLGIVGTIVNLLMKTQRSQRERLLKANIMLSEHAKTLEELAVSHERNRLARELHDTLAHTLSSQILTLEAMKLSSKQQDPELQKSLDQLINNTRHGLDDTRRALKDLRVRQLEDLGLQASLKSLAADAASRANLSTEIFIANRLPSLPSGTEQAIYRIAQEAIDNIVKHANATELELRLTDTENGIKLEISDNGDGFSRELVDNINRMGIKGMRERVSEADGEFALESAIGKGTKIKVLFKDLNDKSSLM
jgi:signal transduction histidine kinase